MKTNRPHSRVMKVVSQTWEHFHDSVNSNTLDSRLISLFLVSAVEDGCYYNYNHYGEGDRIVTNEPCLNCTCHNRMLMCYLRVCPFTKPIGQDCIVEKREDQCCPVITCPEGIETPMNQLLSIANTFVNSLEAVPVQLDDNSSTTISSTDVAMPDNYGCSINGRFYAEGAQVPSNQNKPCELCYCIRNMTACVMQECTLHIDGCQPIYNKGVCCPVRYSCGKLSICVKWHRRCLIIKSVIDRSRLWLIADVGRSLNDNRSTDRRIRPGYTKVWVTTLHVQR